MHSFSVPFLIKSNSLCDCALIGGQSIISPIRHSPALFAPFLPINPFLVCTLFWEALHKCLLLVSLCSPVNPASVVTGTWRFIKKKKTLCSSGKSRSQGSCSLRRPLNRHWQGDPEDLEVETGFDRGMNLVAGAQPERWASRWARAGQQANKYN